MAGVAAATVAAAGLTSIGVALGSSDDTITVLASGDTYTSSASPQRVNGASPKLVVGSQTGDAKLTYLKFTVPASNGKAPASASLVLNRDDHHFPDTTVTLSRVVDTAWDAATLDQASAPAAGALVGTATVRGDDRSATFDVGAVVTAPGTYAFVLSSPVSGDVVRFRSTEGGKGAPTMTIGYAPAPRPTASASTKPQPSPTVGDPTATSSPKPSPTATATAPKPTAPAPTPTGPVGKCTVSDILVPSCGVWQGTSPLSHTSVSRPAALADFERRMSEKADIMHTYHVGGQLFPNKDEIAFATESGRTRMLLINWKPSGSWASVAAGNADAEIDREAAYIKANFRYKFYLAIFHEPENDVNPAAGSGWTATDYRNMYRHTALRLRAQGVDNAVLVMNYMGFVKWGKSAWFDQLYPGDDVVDWIAYDPYARAGSNYNGTDFAKMVNVGADGVWPGMYNWIVKNHPGKPVMLAEWGVGEDAATVAGKPDFFETVPGQLARFPALKALVYFDCPQSNTVGDTRIDTSSASLNAYRSMVDAPAIASAPEPPLMR